MRCETDYYLHIHHFCCIDVVVVVVKGFQSREISETIRTLILSSFRLSIMAGGLRSVNLSDPEIQQAWQEVRNDAAESNW